MKILGFIPARGGSKGLPNKNKKLMLGRPLISYTITAALESEIDTVVVSSDDDDILDIAQTHGAIALRRPPEISGDMAPTLPVLQHAVASLPVAFDAVMTLQPTSPLRNSSHINRAIQIFTEDKDADSLVSVVKTPHKFTAGSLMILNGKYIEPLQDGPLVLRRQEKPNYWGRNGAAIYITSIDKIDQYIFGGKILPMEMNKSESIDIDDIEDWMMAEAIMAYKSSRK